MLANIEQAASAINSDDALESFSQRGKVFISKKHIGKIFELLEQDDLTKVQELIEADLAEELPASDFSEKFPRDLANDLAILREIRDLWSGVKRDPKWLELASALREREVLRANRERFRKYRQRWIANDPFGFAAINRIDRCGVRVTDASAVYSGPNAGGGARRFEAASYAAATFRITSSLPGSARNTSENGRPGAASAVGLSEATFS